MNKTDISKILATGTIKQKIRLIAEDEALEHLGKNGILTDKEFNAIKESLKTLEEINLYNRYRDNEGKLTLFIKQLEGFYFASKYQLSELNGYILLWDSIQKTEIKINLALAGIEDIKKRREIAEEVKIAETLLLTKETLDKEGFIELQTEAVGDKYLGNLPVESSTLLKYITLTRERAITEINKFLAYYEVLTAWMKREDIRPTPYVEIIKDLEKKLRNSSPITPKYQINERGKNRGPDTKNRKALILEKYKVYPDIKAMEPSPELINLMKKAITPDE